jgi:hypothetical protein
MIGVSSKRGRQRGMRLDFAAVRGFDDRLVTLFSFTGTDPGTHGVCADVAFRGV